MLPAAISNWINSCCETSCLLRLLIWDMRCAYRSKTIVVPWRNGSRFESAVTDQTPVPAALLRAAVPDCHWRIWPCKRAKSQRLSTLKGMCSNTEGPQSDSSETLTQCFTQGHPKDMLLVTRNQVPQVTFLAQYVMQFLTTCPLDNTVFVDRCLELHGVCSIKTVTTIHSSY